MGKTLDLDDVAATSETAMEELETMRLLYDEQCACTDEWAEKYKAEVERKADATLLSRIAELELALRVVNARLVEAQEQLAICTQVPNCEVSGGAKRSPP